ncbi:hypothetical protein N665_1443s0006 [Sinapis alba]|nr:hypothetical protein N665_1443s0006 [Sinapis alba]
MRHHSSWMWRVAASASVHHLHRWTTIASHHRKLVLHQSPPDPPLLMSMEQSDLLLLCSGTERWRRVKTEQPSHNHQPPPS